MVRWGWLRSHRRTLAITVGISVGVLAIYGLSFLLFRTVTVASTLNSCFGTVGVVRFTYGAGSAEKAYALARGDAQFIYMATHGMIDDTMIDDVVGTAVAFPLPFVHGQSAGLRTPLPPFFRTLATAPERGWPWRMYAPLERLELHLRGYTAVHLTAAEEREMVQRHERLRCEPVIDLPY